MKQQLNYGYPLASIIIRILSAFLIIFFIIALLIFHIQLIVILLISFVLIPYYVIFGVVAFKKRFNSKRIAILNEILNHANLKGDEIILDLGTGSGFLAIGFSKSLKKGKTIGLDKYSIKIGDLKTQLINFIKTNFFGNTLKNAKINAKIENVEDKCEFIPADITKPFNYSDNYFDIILSCQSLYCLPNKNKKLTFQEINRVLKQDGKIIFFEAKSFLNWNINSVKNYFERIGYKIVIIPSKEFKGCCILSGKK